MDESLRGLERRARAGDREAARAWLAAVHRSGAAGLDRLGEAAGRGHPWARALTSLLGGEARGLAPADPAWRGLARAAALCASEAAQAWSVALPPEAEAVRDDLRACPDCPCLAHEPGVGARAARLEQRLTEALPQTGAPWTPARPLAPGPLAAARALAWAARCRPIEGAALRGDGSAAAAAEGAVREALLALAWSGAPEQADEPDPEHLDALLARLLRDPQGGSADFPAAHSMDTNWFAADGDGHLALFQTGSNGAIPLAAHGDPDLHWDGPRQLGPLPGSAWWRDQVGGAVAFTPAPGGLLEPTPPSPLGALAPLWTLPRRAYYADPPPAALPPHVSSPAPERPARHVLCLLSELDPLEPLLASGAARLLDLPGPPQAVHVDRLDHVLHAVLHRDGVCQGCRAHYGPLELGYQPALEWRQQRQLAHLGVFAYQHACEPWGVAGPYGRSAVPWTPLRAEQLPASVADSLVQVRFPGVCFQELVLFQPARLIPCRAYPQDALEEDLRTRFPVQPRQDAGATGWLVASGPAGPRTLLPGTRGLGQEDLARLSVWLTGEDHLQPAGPGAWRLGPALLAGLAGLEPGQRAQLVRFWARWTGGAGIDGDTLVGRLQAGARQVASDGGELLLREA